VPRLISCWANSASSKSTIRKARRCWSRLLQNDPNSIGALRRLIGYDLSRKQPAKALDRLNAQIEKSPKNSGFYDLLAQLQIQNKNFDQAAAAAQKAIQINPDDGEAVTI